MVKIKLIKQWIKGILVHPFVVFKGNWFRAKNKNEDLFKKRYNKCKFCKDLEYTPIGEVCNLCGCPVESKLRVPEETCELHRW